MSDADDPADVPWTKPKKTVRWYHEVHDEGEVQERLNFLASIGYDLEDPLVQESTADIPGARKYLIRGTRRECVCDCCRRAALRKTRGAKAKDS